MPINVAHRHAGCSPFTLMGCGCGLLGAIGIVLVFLLLGVQVAQERHDRTWNREDYAHCQQNMIRLKLAIASYESDFHALPPRLDDLVPRYLDRPSRLHCPLETKKLGAAYRYHPRATAPTDPLVTCHNHGQGTMILQRNGQIRVPTLFRRQSPPEKY